MFKNMRLIILFDIFFNPSFKMATSFSSVAKITATTTTRRNDFKSSRIGSLYEK